MCVKLDMPNAYNSVEYNYIEAAMKALDFKEQWIKLAMTHVSTINYSILVNEKLGKSFKPTRGLRQGDPYYHIFSLFVLEAKLANQKFKTKRGHKKLSYYKRRNEHNSPTCC